MDSVTLYNCSSKFEDTKRVIRSRKSKIDKQYNGQEKQDKYNKTVIMLNICAQSICLEARQSGLYQIALQNSSGQQWAYENT